jgi:hypothetical protein
VTARGDPDPVSDPDPDPVPVPVPDPVPVPSSTALRLATKVTSWPAAASAAHIRITCTLEARRDGT